MPKKKEKQSIQQDKDNKTQKRETSASNYSGSDDKEKTLYLIQIRYLNEKLERCQLKCEQLEGKNKDLTTRCSLLENEKKDIVEYLKSALLEKEEEVDELTERLERQRQAAQEDRDAQEMLHNRLMQELQHQVTELTTENETLDGRLSDLEEFQRDKDQLRFKMATTEKQLVSQEEEHQAALHRNLWIATLGCKYQLCFHVCRLEKETETVRLVMKETMEVKAQFSQLSKHALVLTEENSALRERRSQLSVDVGNLEQMFKEVSRQSCVQKKVTISAHFLYPNRASMSGTCLHIKANSPDFTRGPKAIFTIVFSLPFSAFLSLHQTMEQLKGKYQRLEHELEDCREELKQLQTQHREVLAEMEAHRSLYACFSCLREPLSCPFSSFVLLSLSRKSSSQTSASSRNTTRSAPRFPSSKNVAKPR
uniref:Cilia- and flagella-associated protein 157 n=1 Tax=Takifugu rubripes TaxID=31033 RepID=H2UT99_TAKRU